MVNGAAKGGGARNALLDAVSGGASRSASRVKLGRAEATAVLVLYADADDIAAVAGVRRELGTALFSVLARFSEAGVRRGGFATWWPRSVKFGGIFAFSFGCSESTSLNRKRKSRPYSWSNYKMAIRR